MLFAWRVVLLIPWEKEKKTTTDPPINLQMKGDGLIKTAVSTVLVSAAITKYRRLDDYWLLIVLEAWKTKIKVPADSSVW